LREERLRGPDRVKEKKNHGPEPGGEPSGGNLTTRKEHSGSYERLPVEKKKREDASLKQGRGAAKDPQEGDVFEPDESNWSEKYKNIQGIDTGMKIWSDETDMAMCESRMKERTDKEKTTIR